MKGTAIPQMQIAVCSLRVRGLSPLACRCVDGRIESLSFSPAARTVVPSESSAEWHAKLLKLMFP